MPKLSALTQFSFSKTCFHCDHCQWVGYCQSISQYADGKSNEIIYDKKKTVTVWKYNTYRVRNHLVPNPTNSKLKRLRIKKI